jgi:hypothetical protein
MNRPRVMTFIAQAALGSMFAYYVLFIVPLFLSGHTGGPLDLGWILVALACFLVLGLFIGVLPGVIIWACSTGHGPLHQIFRCIIAVLLLFPGWLYISLIVFGGDRPRPDQQLWLLGWLVLPSIVIGLTTGSRLRIWHELVRGGEAVGRVPRLFAGLTGLVLRMAVVLLFIASVPSLIALEKYQKLQHELIWTMLLCGHFTASLLVVFLKSDFRFVAAVAAIALVPLVIALIALPESLEVARYVLYGYLALWAMFLLTRWRQTDVALSFLNEEIHYYLID